MKKLIIGLIVLFTLVGCQDRVVYQTKLNSSGYLTTTYTRSATGYTMTIIYFRDGAVWVIPGFLSVENTCLGKTMVYVCDRVSPVDAQACTHDYFACQ